MQNETPDNLQASPELPQAALQRPATGCESKTPHAILSSSLSLLKNLAYTDSIRDFTNTAENATHRGILRRLRGHGLGSSNCTVGYLREPNVRPSFHLSYCGENFSYVHSNDLITMGSGVNFPAGNLLGKSNDPIVQRLAAAFGEAQRLIAEEILHKRNILQTALESSKSNDLESLAQAMLDLDAAISGINALMSSPELCDIYLSEDDQRLQTNLSGYDCRPLNALQAIKGTLAKFDQAGVQIGMPLIMPAMNAMKKLGKDIKKREPVSLTAHRIRQTLAELLADFGGPVTKSGLSLPKLTSIKSLHGDVTRLLRILSLFNRTTPTTCNYLNAILEIAEPEWAEERPNQ